MPEIAAPPKWMLLLLWPFKGESCYPQIEGDLREEFQYQEARHGIADARRWYLREIRRNLWCLTMRRETIEPIVLPLLFVALRDVTPIPFMYLLPPLRPVLEPLLAAPGTAMHIVAILAILLPTTIIPGLAFPVICGALLRGHERLVRMAFTACWLGLSVIYGINHFNVIIESVGWGMPGILSPVIVLGLLGPIYILPFIWMSSIWVERRRYRQAAA